MLGHSKVILRLMASWSLQTSTGILASTSYAGGPLPKSSSTIQRLAAEHPAKIMAFDILALNYADTRKESLVIRKKLPRKAWQEQVDYVRAFRGKGRRSVVRSN